MPKTYSAKEVYRKLKKYGFVEKSQKWSHLKLIRDHKTVILPMHAKDIPLGTFRSILEQADISYDDFQNI